MTSASVLFYGNRRSRASRRFDEPALDPSSSSPDRNRSFSYLRNSSSSKSTSGIRDITPDRRCHRFSSQNLRHNHCHDLVNDEYKYSRRSSQISSASSSEYEANHRGHGICALPSVNISNSEPWRHANSNSGGADRLPRPVVLAKERLVQRLRNVSVSGTRQSRETSSSSVAERPEFWFVDAADWEASILTEAGHSRLSEHPSEIHDSPRPRAPIKKPPGLDKEMLACLSHEVFFAVGKSGCEPISAVCEDCSICLDSFVEGNQLTNLPCGHKFHTACLYPWIRSCGECPYCRTTIVLTGHRR